MNTWQIVVTAWLGMSVVCFEALYLVDRKEPGRRVMQNKKSMGVVAVACLAWPAILAVLLAWGDD